MEAARAVKRRKLDTLEEGDSKSSPAQRSARSGDITIKKTRGDEADKPATNGTRSKSEAHDNWQQAKAKARELKGKKLASTPQKPREVDVYDDIEGAHATSRSRLKPIADAAKAMQLDPLRNQDSASPAKSSPSKANGGLDFFKRFAKPRHEDALARKEAEGAAAGEKNTAADRGQKEKSQEVEMQDVDQQSSATRSGKGAWKSWAYAAKAKKTFEDEIRDLEKAAKENAANEDEKNGVDRPAPRRRGRHSTTPAGAGKDALPAPAAKFMPVITPRTAAKTGGRVKQPNGDPDVLKTRTEAAQGGEMDVDEKNELEQQLRVETRTKPSATTPLKQKLQQPTKKAAKPALDLQIGADHLQSIKSAVLGQLTGSRSVRLTNLDDEYAKVLNVVSQTIAAGESNSMLLIGSRGSGKTTLINQIIREQAVEHPDDFHVVRLNGFIHTDDKIALREIWRQLGRETDLDEEESNFKNYADTLTSLLALLSHPVEQGREQQQGRITKSVIFVLDEFELFATHPRQMLLYNLFDIAQSRKAPITVLGITTKIDVAETLEKRVKSRFSHRYVHLSSAKSFNAFQESCRAALVLREEDLQPSEKDLLTTASSSKDRSKPAGNTLGHWTTCIDALFAQEDMLAHLRHIYYTTKSIPDFHAFMLLPISSLSTDRTTSATDLLTHLTPTPTSSLAFPDSKLSLLSSLSTLHHALLICAARLTAIHAQDTIPFAQAYEEYKTIASKAKIQASASGALAQGAVARIYSKDVARDVWSELVQMGLVMEDGVRGGRVDVGLEEIGGCGVELGSWGRWCREI